MTAYTSRRKMLANFNGSANLGSATYRNVDIPILDQLVNSFKCLARKVPAGLAGGDAIEKDLALATRPDRNWYLANVIKIDHKRHQVGRHRAGSPPKKAPNPAKTVKNGLGFYHLKKRGSTRWIISTSPLNRTVEL